MKHTIKNFLAITYSLSHHSLARQMIFLPLTWLKDNAGINETSPLATIKPMLLEALDCWHLQKNNRTRITNSSAIAK